MGISFLSAVAGGMFSARIYYEYFWWQVAIIIVAYSFVRPKTDDSDILHRDLVQEHEMKNLQKPFGGL